MEKLIISPAPHIHGGDSVSKNMTGVIIALVPACWPHCISSEWER